MEKNYKEKMYLAFKAISKMEIDESKKIGMLTYLFSIEPNCWRVIGISIDAIKVFQKNGFQRKSKMGINRSHIKRRFDSYKEILHKESKGEFKNHDEWWNFYFDNDKTILQTSSENMKKNGHSRVIEISNPDWTLFKSKGYAWNHGNAEVVLLRKLYEEHCSGT
jgi:hypothetical protein